MRAKYAAALTIDRRNMDDMNDYHEAQIEAFKRRHNEQTQEIAFLREQIAEYEKMLMAEWKLVTGSLDVIDTTETN